jgi:hypothetical protein
MSYRSRSSRLAAALIPSTLAFAAAGGASAASGLDNESQFGQIAKNGFALTVNGAFFADPANTQYPSLQPNLGSAKNNYAWSMAWFDGALWVGTNRNIRQRNLAARGPAEIWRYQPSSNDAAGDWGLSGTWTRVFQSPKIPLTLALFSQGQLSRNTARDLGYRDMAVCNAGDGTERLYVASTGVPGNILYYDGQTFERTSSEGLFNNLGSNPYRYVGTNLTGVQIDFGYRGLACFKGRLWTSPAGERGDADATAHPVVHMSPDPAHGAAWQTMVDVKGLLADGTPDPAASPLADPGNIGIFQIEAVGRYLWLTTLNRTTGMELWRGDGIDCLEPWVGDGHCNITWAKIIDNGAGRPPDIIGPPLDNAGGTLGVFGNDLYVAPSESGINQLTLAEMIRVPNAGSVPPGGPSAPHTWQLLVGWPRKDFADAAKRLPGLENLDCTNVGDFASSMSELPQAVLQAWQTFNGFGLRPAVRVQQRRNPIPLDDDDDNDDCLPATNAGPGFPTGTIQHPLAVGQASYFWRFAEHQGDLFVGTLDVVDGFHGFDLLKTPDGARFTWLFTDGLGNRFNYGGRTLQSTPIGLAVGTANPFTRIVNAQGVRSGGAEVFIGTTALPP